MKQLSLRGFDKDLARCLRNVARRERLSLNKTALLLMRRGAGLVDSPGASATVGDALDAFVGKWSEEQEKELLSSIEACETVDESLWG
jgi:hypothetical protein